ncbi:MAG: hypothetical protein WC449_05165 [Candidatus Paceibacterota bacterium]
MACCGQRITKKKKVIVPKPEAVEDGYNEGDYGFVKVSYNGDLTIKVNGCKTGNRYLFGKGSVRSVDYGDAQCLFDLMPGAFQEVVEVVKKAAKKAIPVVESLEDGIKTDNSESEYIPS